MRLPRAAFALPMLLLLLSGMSFAAKQAICTFNTFTAPQGYLLAQVIDITDDGTVVGQVQDNNSGAFLGFTRTADGKFSVWDAPNSAFTWFSSRNLSAVNVGSFLDNARVQHVHGLAQAGNGFVQVDYPKASYTWVFGINTAGAVVGSFSNSPGVVSGFKLMNGKYTAIKYPRMTVTNPQSINDNGQVVGSYFDGTLYHGFSWQNGKYTTIDYPNSKFGTSLTDVNNYGVIVGNHLSADRAFGFIYKNGTLSSIVYAGAKYATTGGINNSGVISGQIFYTQTDTLGFTAVCK